MKKRKPTSPPRTLDEILQEGTSWSVDKDKERYKLTYILDGEVRTHTYQLHELIKIDERVVKVLHAANGYVSDEALQVSLKKSHQLWSSDVHVIPRKNTLHFAEKITSVAPVPDGNVKVSYNYYALYALVDGLPVAKGGQVIVTPTVLPLENIEAAFPGFTQAYTIAMSLDMAPFDAGKFCMEHIRQGKQEVAVTASVELPTNLTL